MAVGVNLVMARIYVRTKLFLRPSLTFCPPFCALESPSLTTSLTPCPMLLTCASRPFVSPHIAGDVDSTHQSYGDCSGLMVWFREHSSLHSSAHSPPHLSHLSLRPELPLTTSSSPSLEVSVSVCIPRIQEHVRDLALTFVSESMMREKWKVVLK